MPKLEPKQIQRELEQGKLWPVYWIYGSERRKSREVLKRIRAAVLNVASGPALLLGEESFDGNETDPAAILDAALSPSLGGGVRLILIRDAHALKNPDSLSQLFGPAAQAADLTSVCVFISKDLDGRKKFSKALIEKAAVVPCEEVSEADREAWIQYLAKSRGMPLSGEWVSRLALLDPWSLDIVDQELEKLSLLGGAGDSGPDASAESFRGAEAFLNAFFSKDFETAIREVGTFADQPDESLPLLGLLAWNLRHLILFVADKGAAKLNPFLVEKFRAWSRHWALDELMEMQRSLAELDFGLKQTPLLPLGLWSALVMLTSRGEARPASTSSRTK